MVSKETKDTIVGSMLSLNGIFMFAPPSRAEQKPPTELKDIAAYFAQYFTVPNTRVVFVTKAYEHYLVENAAEAERVWRRLPLWYVLVIRADVLTICRKQIPIRGVSELP